MSQSPDPNPIDRNEVKRHVAEIKAHIAEVKHQIEVDRDHARKALMVRYLSIMEDLLSSYISLVNEFSLLRAQLSVGEIATKTYSARIMEAISLAAGRMSEIEERKEPLLAEMDAFVESDPADWWKHGKKA